ncbi:MAG: Hsp20/alpha crystallin family protein [Actinobacteria bacterium]|nr:Hsp20/alpha crystallin family protein [Actinomycetota bacterium]
MALIRWNPWSIDRFLDEDLDIPTLPGFSRLVGQGLNLYETEDSIVAEAAIPGVPEDRIDVTVDKDGTVRITGSVEDTKEDRLNIHLLAGKDQQMGTFQLVYNLLNQDY